MLYFPVRRWAICLSALLLCLWGCAPPDAVTQETPPTALGAVLLTAWTAGEERVLLDTPMPLTAVEDTYFALQDAVPELFWAADSFSYTAIGEGVVAVTPHYLCPPSTLPSLRAALATAVDDLLAVLPPQGSEYARAYALHDALAAVTEYGRTDASPLGEMGAYTAYGALVDGVAVCRGYAMGYLVLLARAGITAMYVKSESMGHGWVRARLDGRWYHIDVTWDDRSPTSHQRFARTDKAMQALGYTGWECKIRQSQMRLPPV